MFRHPAKQYAFRPGPFCCTTPKSYRVSCRSAAMARWESGYPADCKSVYSGSTPLRASTFIHDAWDRTTGRIHLIAAFQPRRGRDRTIERGCSSSGGQENGNEYHDLGANCRFYRRLRHTSTCLWREAHARAGHRRLRQKAYWRALVPDSVFAASVADTESGTAAPN